MRNLDFTISLFSLLLYFFTNRIHYICAMKSYDEDKKVIYIVNLVSFQEYMEKFH